MTEQKPISLPDKGEKLIEEIRAELDDLTRTKNALNAWPKERWGIGKRAKDQNNDMPRVDWVEVGGEFGDAKLSGGNNGAIATDAARYQLTVWHASTGSCRATLHNIYLAARNKAYGPNMKFGPYAWVDDATIKLGRKLTLIVTLHLPVSTEVAPTETVETNGHEVKVNGQVVC